MNNIKSHKVQSRISDDLWIEIKKKAGETELSISAIIRALLRLWVSGKVKI